MPDVKPPQFDETVKPPSRLSELAQQAPTKGAWFWQAIQRIDPLETALNRALINRSINVLEPRPYRLSTRADFTSYETLMDKTYNARQLPRVAPKAAPKQPDLAEVGALFKRTQYVECEKSTVLFAYMAQWFTDGFLRSTDRAKLGKNRLITRTESTHEVDLSQLYGLTEDELAMLRDLGDRTRLDAQKTPVGEIAPDMYRGGKKLERYEKLRVIRPDNTPIVDANLLAMGSDAANVQIGYAIFNTLFLREHNRIAAEIQEAQPGWEPNQVFGAARNVLTVLLIRLVIEEYINHIHPYHFRFRLDPRGFDKQRWMRPNWVAVEFNLLYRWHSLIPDTLDIGAGPPVALGATMYQTKPLLTKPGLATLIDCASRQPAGRFGMHNTPKLLEPAEIASVKAGRDLKLCGYNEYRAACKFRKASDFSDVTKDAALAAELKALYGDVDKLELFVGMFAEDRRPNSVLPPLIGRLVGLHAFSQLMTNPLFGRQVYNTETFSPRGAQIIAETKSLADIVRRNIPTGTPMPEVRLTRKDWRPV
jgi:prostaglandin-endoperoxide synthase 2